MKTTFLKSFFVAAFTLLILVAPRTSAALDLIVEHSPTDPSHFSDIQAAIDYASAQLAGPPASNTTFRIVVKADPSPYYGTFTPISNVPIVGSETARTYLDQFGSGPLISINNATNITIKNFTINSRGTGIAITNSTSVTIANNIFRAGFDGIALQLQYSPSTAIVNNTFYQNGTALSTNADCLITNNIFADNVTAIATLTNLSRLTYNTYHNNGSNGAITLDANSIPNISVPNPDPLFVDPTNNDFHLQSGSPCHINGGGNAGNPAYPNADNPLFFDMGAYGGPDSDTIPFRIMGLTATSGTDANFIDLTWNPNMGYQISGYHVYYGTTAGDRSGTGATEGSSPVMVPQGMNSATLSNLPLTPTTTPAAVPRVMLSPEDGALYIIWTPSADATSYKVYYGTTAFTEASLPATFLLVDSDNSAGFFLEGLTNGVTYFVAVAAIAQSKYFLSVTAFNTNSGTPGVSNESDFATERIAYLGPLRESTISPVVSATPVLQPINVSNPGSMRIEPSPCFIATAAYGCYSAPQVQLLRDFRDRFLMTNAPGRVFVAWYYRYGPYGAAFIIAQPWCKPMVRLLLLPLVGGAMFLLHTSVATKCVVMCGMLALGGVIIRLKRKECRPAVVSGQQITT